MSLAYVALGSNLGERRQQLEAAIAAMREAGVKVVEVSTFIETVPYGVTEQPPFLNGVCAVETSLPPQALLKLLLSIEQRLGRVRELHWGPRVIDLDLLLYEDQIIEEPNLVVPHPDMENRSFVLQPLVEIAPEVMHPKLKKTMRELLQVLLNK